jgi:hypothetical protein
MPITRRDLFGRVSGALVSPLLLSRSDAQVTPEVLKFSAELEPLVALIERTPRDKCAEMAVEQMHAGVSYRQFLAALFLAGIRNINPRPPAPRCIAFSLGIHAAGSRPGRGRSCRCDAGLAS